MMKDLHTTAQAGGKAVEPKRHNHELLHVNGVIRMFTTVDDVHHRGRQQIGADTTQVTVKRLFA